MPPLANSEKIIKLFKALFNDPAQMSLYIKELAKVMKQSHIDPNFLPYRYQIFKKLVKITQTKDELLWLINSHDAILKSVIRLSTEDITGYHHDYSLKQINHWIKISNNSREFLKIVFSKTPASMANIIANKNKNL